MEELEILEEWNNNIIVRIKDLDRWSRIYRIIHILNFTIAAGVNAAIPMIGMYFISTEFNTAGKITTFIFSCVSVICSIIALVINPDSKSEKCHECVKGYSELQRELEADIAAAKDTEIFEDNKAKWYAIRERLVIYDEPLILLYNRNKFEVVEYIDDHNKSRFTKIKEKIIHFKDKIKRHKDETDE